MGWDGGVDIAQGNKDVEDEEESVADIGDRCSLESNERVIPLDIPTDQNKTPEQLWLQGMLQAHGSGWREVQAIYDHPDNITDWSQYHK